MSNSSIMSVREMIDNAFGDTDANIVDFKLIQAVLYLLARQLRLLERRVGIELEAFTSRFKTSLSVTEIKISATVPKRRKSSIKVDDDSKIIHTTSDKDIRKASKTKSISTQQSKSEKTIQEKSAKSSSDKTTSEKTKSSTDKTSLEPTKSTTDKSSSDRTKSATDKTSSEVTKSNTDKSSSGQTKSATDQSSSDRTKSATDKTSSDRTKSATDKTSSEVTKSTTDKSSSDRTKSATDKTSSEVIKSTTDKSSSDRTKSTTDKTSSEQTKSSTDKASSEQTKSTTDKSSSDQTKSTTDKTSSEQTKSSTDKSSSEKTKSSTDKTSSDKTKSSTDKTTSSSKKSSSAKDTSDKSSSDLQRKDLPKLLEFIEEQREKELRVIHQRADSREVGGETPTPMASLDSVERQVEKLLVVERVPSGRSRSSIGRRTPRLSIVTQDQFEELASLVRELQSRFTTTGVPELPENAQLMQDLRKGASLTDAMAALQLSARLEAAEKTLKQMMELVTDLACKSGMEIELKSSEAPYDAKVVHEATATSTPQATPQATRSKKSVASKQSKKTLPVEIESTHVLVPSSEPSNIDNLPTPTSVPGPEEEKNLIPLDWITYDDLDNAIQEVSEGLFKTLTTVTKQSNINAENAIKTAKKLEEKLDSSLDLGTRMIDLELLVSAFSEQITTLDTGLSSQMTNYQEQLTQMQHDLEAGLEAMAEALANTGGDTAAVAELNAQFTNLQLDVDGANTLQKELKDSQNGLSLDLKALWQEIELLRGIKSDRDEVADALRDKAGLSALNGLVSLQQFNANRGDFEKRIGEAYDKFNNQEITWQKAIDDLFRELQDKVDWDQLVALRNDINKNLEVLHNRTLDMLEIVGEPRAATTTRKLFRDAACLSCSSPAHMDLEEICAVPKLPAFMESLTTRPPTIGAEDTSKPAEDGDHKVCFPGLPIPHPRDPRAHVCNRYCGGSHTLVTEKKTRAPVGIIVTPVSRPVKTGIGSDGKTYILDETSPAKKPCRPCNAKNFNTPQPSEAEPATEKQEFDSDMTPSDFMSTIGAAEPSKDGTATPPPPDEGF